MANHAGAAGSIPASSGPTPLPARPRLPGRLVFACILLALLCAPSFAGESGQQTIPYAHAAWGPDEGVPPHIEAIAQTARDFLWIGSGDGLYRFDGLTFERFQTRTGPSLPRDAVVCLLALPDGDLWIGFYSGGISLLRNGRAVNYGRRDGLPGVTIFALAQDPGGTLWASSSAGLFRLEKNAWKRIGRAWGFPGGQARALYVDRSGTLWVAAQNTLVFLPKGARKFQPTGIPVGIVRGFAQAPNGRLWMAETTRSVRPVPRPTSLAPSAKTEVRVGSEGILFSRSGALWITTLGDGLLRSSDPQKLSGKPDRFSPSLQSYTVEDGLSNQVDTCVFQDRDGNIWVATLAGLDRFLLTPANNLRPLSRDPQPRPPSVESIVANGQSYTQLARLKLPAGTKNIEIHYTAADLANPWLIQFRYRLDGVDAQWQDVGARRVAYYTNLRPGNYQFHVLEGNELRGWRSQPGLIDFTIPPFWYQRVWFRALCVAIPLLLLWTLYQLRLRQLRLQFSLALETRLDERTRIARELHDTLLQSFHGLLFQFQAARNLLPRKPDSAIRTLDKAILSTEQALAEGRDAIRGLRPETASQRDLAELLTEAGHGLAEAGALNGHRAGFRVIVEGKPRRLAPALHGEVYRIGREVILNAFRHAMAESIEVEILYDEPQLRLRIRDDGKGIDRKDLESSGRPGHWGLPGIRERAQRIGSQLDFWTETGAGTEVELRVPAAVAYEKQQQQGSRFRLFHHGGSNGRRA